MVQLANVAAINSQADATLTSTGETAEAQEARIHHLYDSALQMLRDGDLVNAAVGDDQHFMRGSPQSAGS